MGVDGVSGSSSSAAAEQKAAVRRDEQRRAEAKSEESREGPSRPPEALEAEGKGQRVNTSA